jgi:hypothetical protein
VGVVGEVPSFRVDEDEDEEQDVVDDEEGDDASGVDDPAVKA